MKGESTITEIAKSIEKLEYVPDGSAKYIHPNEAGSSFTQQCPPHTTLNTNNEYISVDKEQTIGDQIIEINSNSTTSSEEQKRNTINSKHQLQLILQQQTFNTNNNKFSTETTSDFPVSSPSNQYDRPGPPQKNTLPADNFERSLALLTTQTPQMSLTEKINSWKCDLDLSDVEDVGNFDDLFKQHEEMKQNVINGTCSSCTSVSKCHYGFSEFRNKVLPRIKASNSFKEKNDEISSCFEYKKRQQLEMLRVDCGVTSTFTTSSENEMVYNPEEKFKDLRVVGLKSGREIPPPKSIGDLHATCKNKVIDRNNQNNKSNSNGLIKMRLDFAIQNKSQHLHEKKMQLFKTSTVRQDYLPIPVPINLPMILNAHANNSKINCSPTKTNFKNLNVEHQSEEYYIPMQKPLRGNDQNYSTFSFSAKASTPAGNFHQQHEFCNYLGLTGMSTANAVANAVAELAKCNLTRRSLRVRRLMQQEKKENNRKLVKTIANGDELVKKRRCEVSSASPICKRQNEMMWSHVKNEEKNVSVNKFRKPTQSRSTIVNKGSKADISVVKNVSFEKDPAIKIVCKISNSVKEKSTEKFSEELSAPLRQSRLHYVKPNYSNDTSTCPRSSISDVIGEIIREPTPNLLRNRNSNLRPRPTQTSACSLFKNTMVSEPVVEPDVIKHQLYDKFKQYLDASRKVKPSIYIVQTLHNIDPQEHKQNQKVFVDVGVETSLKQKKNNDKIVEAKQQVLVQSKRQNPSLLSHESKKKRLRRLLALATSWHKKRNHRQIHNLKTSFYKKKSASNRCGKATEKKTKSNQSGNCSTASLSKSYKSNNQGRKHKLKQVNKARTTSRAMASPADTSVDQHSSKTDTKMTTTKKVYATPVKGLRRERYKSSLAEGLLFDTAQPETSSTAHERLETRKSIIENETVVVSSTTNSYDEETLFNMNKIPSQSHQEVTTVQKKGSHAILTKDQSTETAPPLDIYFIHPPKKELANPVKAFNGHIDYIYYEMDVLIVVQEKTVSFWKYFKLINVLAGFKESENYKSISNEESYLPSYMQMDEASPQWVPLGECRRITTDMEISTSYANRICVHNSMAIYIEMRCREIPRERRDCNLLSMYINVYYFNDDDMVAKMHSIQLDAVQGIPSDVVYTTITESRYFVMSWPHENILGKPRSGLCKYSLTPNLDTLASIRDFKHMRHRIRYLECSTDGKLIGFGDTQLTIWDHRSGDVLMNYDFNIKLGHNLGSIYYPSLEIGQDNMLILFQYTKIVEAPEVLLIGCSVSHTSPSHRILKRLKMPNLAFNTIQNAINTGDNIIITAENDEEIWINCTDPTHITRVPPQHSRRFYQRGKSHIIELTSKSLMVDSFANHVLKLAANQTLCYDKVQV